jgi:guanyl-specific ribonuclease Sa
MVIRMRIRLVAGAGALALLSACTSAHTYADSAVTSAQATPSRPASSPAADTASTSAPATAAASKTSVTISAAGDTMLGNTPDLPSSPGTYLDMVKRDLTHNAQIVFGNLEGTLTTATTSKCGTVKPSDKKKAKTCFAFRLPPSYARYLHRAGFTAGLRRVPDLPGFMQYAVTGR